MALRRNFLALGFSECWFPVNANDGQGFASERRRREGRGGEDRFDVVVILGDVLFAWDFEESRR